MQQITEFRLNSKALFDRIEEIKKNPPQEFIEYKEAHPEFRAVNCALLAEYIGLSEKTLTNLKLGKLTDSNCSTAWLICNTLGLDLRDYFGIPRRSDCNPDACSSDVQARLDEKRQRIHQLETSEADLKRDLAALHIEYGSANARAEGLERLLTEKEGSIARRDRGIFVRNRIIFILILVFGLLILSDILLANFGWFRFGPIK